MPRIAAHDHRGDEPPNDVFCVALDGEELSDIDDWRASASAARPRATKAVRSVLMSASSRAAFSRSAPFVLPRLAAAPTANADGASTRPFCAPPWRWRSAHPMRGGLGTGRPPMTPARRQPSCSSANSVRPPREGRGARRHADHAGPDLGSSSPTRAAPRTAVIRQRRIRNALRDKTSPRSHPDRYRVDDGPPLAALKAV
jgi:hypothetical protein